VPIPSLHLHFPAHRGTGLARILPPGRLAPGSLSMTYVH
jgi:hypothetical protein